MRAAEGGIRGFVSGRVSVRNAGETAGCDGYVQEGARGIGKANPISRELGLADYCLLTPRWAYVFYNSQGVPARGGAETKRPRHEGRAGAFLAPPTGFEPVISAVKGRRPRPLDDGGN